MILLVRHAVAVARRSWDGPDEGRPLTERGRRQADRLPARLEGLDAVRIVSSPALRCTATVEGLALARRLPLERSGALKEGRGDRAVDLVLDLVEDAVLCTHGDVIDEVLAGVRKVGWAVPDNATAAKGSTWVLSPRAPCVYLEPPA